MPGGSYTYIYKQTMVLGYRGGVEMPFPPISCLVFVIGFVVFTYNQTKTSGPLAGA